MPGIHSKNMTYWSYTELIFMSQVKAVQAIDQLRRTCQCDFFRMPVEHVERHGTKHSVPERGGLFEKVFWGELTARTIPWSPFIDHQLHFMPRIKLAHRFPVTFNE